ncbi:hypothetical protein KBZ20_10455 [Vulcanococcus limneticus Candia 3F8]|nr:hypothetical protein [Vulcanococcus limneticus]MCP9792561.1 hypothetical protein [Vulcanococcus limneticus MW73D5]MCP9894192.1 hypothetical protein [Vulcanococcus limneticus Candia 3F8]MCP9897953.1 hypothetical protein [Vulcanococcus limneticus Candia 3B3]
MVIEGWANGGLQTVDITWRGAKRWVGRGIRQHIGAIGLDDLALIRA